MKNYTLPTFIRHPVRSDTLLSNSNIHRVIYKFCVRIHIAYFTRITGEAVTAASGKHHYISATNTELSISSVCAYTSHTSLASPARWEKYCGVGLYAV